MNTLRAEKTTRNKDDFRVLMAGTMFAILLMTVGPTISKLWDLGISTRPYVSATLQIVPHEGEPQILYDADANQEVDGTWVASMVDDRGAQLVTRRGEGSYSEKIDDPRLWTWFAFFDNDRGLNSPGVPNVPFKVCVRYIVAARDSGITDESPEYCSQLFDPNALE